MTISSKRAAAAAFALVASLTACSADDDTSTPAIPTPTGEADARWTTLPAAPTERLEVAAAAVDDQVFVAGGFVRGGVTARVEVFDTVARAWRVLSDLPVAVHHAMGVAFQGGFVVLGGFTSADFSTASRRVFAFRGDRWTELASMRRPRAAGGAGVVGDRIVVAGGQDGAGLVAETEVFDGHRWQDGAPIPTPRDHLAAASDGAGLYVIGGRRLSIESVLGVVERYDPDADRWETLPELPTPRGGMGAALAGGRIVVPGGEGPRERAGSDGVYEEVEAYLIAEGRWQSLPAMPTPRHGIGVAAIGTTVYVAVGGPRAGGSYSDAFEALSLET